MARNRDVPELLEQFMEESGGAQCWVTVNEFRTYFDLDEGSAPAISGFLQRIYQGPFFSCPYRVERIERVTLRKRQSRVVKRYLVTRRPRARKWEAVAGEEARATDGSHMAGKGSTGADTGVPEHGRTGGTCATDVLTDYSAVEIFDRVLLKNQP